MTAQRTFYEWAIEDLDVERDILNVIHADTYQEALRAYNAPLADGIARNDLCLVRRVVRDGSCWTRAWAYIEDGKLPVQFDDGTKVPARFHREVERIGYLY